MEQLSLAHAVCKHIFNIELSMLQSERRMDFEPVA